MRMLMLPLLLVSLHAQQAPTAMDEAKKAKADSVAPVPASAAVGAVANATSPVAAGATLLTGALSSEIKKKVEASTWAMTMTQKYAAKAIADYLSKQEKEPFEVTNSKVENLVILTFKSPGMTAEKALRLAKQDAMEKYRKTGWDRIIFTNGTDAWAWDTSKEIEK
ncbi:MAG TPA: hypothetical protein VJ623_11865 [Holophagaceae bacterium]|nr:hypothetical protein [Holophagaceae bacterium]